MSDSGGETHGTVVCDLDGVLYLDRTPIPGAGDALRRISTAGFRLVFVTNNSMQTPSLVLEQVESRTGFDATGVPAVTSATAAASLLAGSIGSAYVVGSEAIVRSLREVGIERTTEWRAADAVVVGLDKDLSYRTLAEATLALRSGARFVATNDDATYPTPEGLHPGGGSIVAALERASGRRAEVAGKPHAPIRDLVRDLVGDGPVWMVGDKPETDLALGKGEGWTTVLVLTGVTEESGAVPDDLRADAVIDSIADLPDLLDAGAGPPQRK